MTLTRNMRRQDIIRRGKALGLIALATPLIFAAFYLTRHFSALTSSCEKGADHELMGIAIELAGRGQALTGPYSRFGFRHPGPLLQYWYALGEFLLPIPGTPMGRHLIAQLALNTLLLLISAWWSFHFLRPRICGVVSTPLTIFVLSSMGKPYFHDYWNPSVTVLPTLVLLESAAAISVGRAIWLLPFTLAALIMGSAHVSCLPIIAVVFVAAAAKAFNCERKLKFLGERLQRWKFLLVLGAAATLICFAPPLFEAFYSTQGGNIGSFLSLQRAAPWRTDFLGAAEFILSYFGAGWESLLSIPDAVLGLALMGIVLLRSRHSSGVSKALAHTLAFLIITSWLLALRVQGALHPHIFRCLLGAAMATNLLILSYAASKSQRMVQSNWGIRSHNHLPLVALFAMCSVAFSLLLVPDKFISRAAHPKALTCGAIAAPFIEALKPQAGSKYHLILRDPGAWPFAAPFTLGLLRLGAEVCVDEEWRYLFDRTLTCEWRGHSATEFMPLYIASQEGPEPQATTRHFKGPINSMWW